MNPAWFGYFVGSVLMAFVIGCVFFAIAWAIPAARRRPQIPFTVGGITAMSVPAQYEASIAMLLVSVAAGSIFLLLYLRFKKKSAPVKKM
jgi:hypothetical protein